MLKINNLKRNYTSNARNLIGITQIYALSEFYKKCKITPNIGLKPQFLAYFSLFFF